MLLGYNSYKSVCKPRKFDFSESEGSGTRLHALMHNLHYGFVLRLQVHLMNKISMPQTCLSYKKGTRLLVAIYGRHLAIVQHNTNFITVHSRVTVGSCLMEYKYKLLCQFAHAVAHRMLYTSILSIRMTLLHGHTNSLKKVVVFFQFAIVCLQSYWVPVFGVSSRLSATVALFCCKITVSCSGSV